MSKSLVERIDEASKAFYEIYNKAVPDKLIIGALELQELMAFVEGAIALDPGIPMNEDGEKNRAIYNGMKIYVVNAVNFLEVL